MNKTAKINNLMMRSTSPKKIAKIPAIDVVLWSENTNMRHRDLQEHHRQKVSKSHPLPKCVFFPYRGGTGNSRPLKRMIGAIGGLEVEGWEVKTLFGLTQTTSLPVISNPDSLVTGGDANLSISATQITTTCTAKHLPQPIIRKKSSGVVRHYR